ncbi:MAG: ComEA family DNA-binding protein [Pseudomonadota bacterium]|nr:ComEA family DNA-binding protein [Pseudomonadota bacterium]
MNTRILTFLALLLTSVCGASSACAESLTTMDSVEHVASKHTLVNLNAANVEQLMALPGIGKSKAQAIVAYREEQGPFSSVDDLINVKGIGKKLLAKLAASVEVR